MEYRELVKRLQYEMAEKLDSSMTVKVGKMEKEPEGTYTVLSIGFADKDMVQGWMINVDALYLEHPELGVSGMVWEITKSNDEGSCISREKICGGISVLDSRESGYNEEDSNERK